MEIIDISHPLGTHTAAWPGDRPCSVEWTLRRDRGDSVNVAALATSVHVGTHADGPLHTGDGPAAGALPLEPFLGAAVVVDARPHLRGEPPLVDEGVLEGVDAATTPRLLLRTRDHDDPARFPGRFAALSPSLCRRLAERGFRLVGTDAPSVDPMDSKELEAHRVLVEAGIPNLENLALSGVRPGAYTLVALPLRLAEADSSPVRAVLLRAGIPEHGVGGQRSEC
ncbi:MAG TPA: cyclase family protein [Longimicrobiales bacterium]|nr:cyclase family protein [Longimicrobiales bacterium]